ncbi:MAG: SpoIIE family protein phosphatase [Brevinematales bacterium]|nr:SpoIIE family protein phosphatase [Brevinematales bacterium]
MSKKDPKTSSNLSKILDINKKINSYSDLRDILENILLSARELFNATGGSILLIDSDRKYLEFEVVHGEGKGKLEGIKIPVNKGIAGYIFSTKSPVISNDVASDSRFFSQIDKITGLKTQKLIGVPLIKDGQSIGVIEVVNKFDGSDFTEYDLELLSIFAEQVVIAINNAMMIKKIQERARELEYLYEISNTTISSIQNIKEVFDKIVNIVSEISDASRVSIMLYDGKDNVLKIVSSIGFDEDPSSISVGFDEVGEPSIIAFREGRHIIVPDIDKDPMFKLNKKLWYKTNSFLVFPIKTHNSVVGVLNITELEDIRKLEKEDIELIQVIANQIGYVYESITTYQREMEKKAFDKEIEVMRKIQMSMLPSVFNIHPKLDICFYVEPYKIVGGDFYDVFSISDDEVCFFLGDVSGKGLHSSIFMAAIKSTLKALSFEFKSPRRILEASNSILSQSSETSMFSTVFLGILNTVNGTLRFSNAGHSQQVILRNGEIIKLYTPGLPIGLYAHARYEESEIKLNTNDFIVVYSDGITESVNEKEEMFGEERLMKLISENFTLSATSLVNVVIEKLKEYKVENPNYDDDISLGIIKLI